MEAASYTHLVAWGVAQLKANVPQPASLPPPLTFPPFPILPLPTTYLPLHKVALGSTSSHNGAVLGQVTLDEAASINATETVLKARL